MAEAKTRDKIVNEARELFAKQGYDNVNINDIASASKVGRRTVYTYFKGKDEIYMAVIEAELERLMSQMAAVAQAELSPDRKLLELIFTRLVAIKEVVHRNGSLKADFFQDIMLVEKVRKRFDRKEMGILRRVLNEGVKKGVFHVDNVGLTVQIIHYCLKGLEVPFIKDTLGIGISDAMAKRIVANILAGALRITVVKEDNTLEA
ncbi:MAG: TetR/AcrR family transcriptional regulator [Bacteroidaceae bacterium]|nr:TetR/AcrR family transcriptional regulator [Bacteroidaceae bacterium]MBQ8008377.1 TetR/AcrR family transcriptional regulator [Bacteroidaceae bacterium]